MNSNVKQVSGSQVDEKLTALLGNAAAIRAIATAVEGTLGPKGLNCMLVDSFGEVTITNDGSAILEKVEQVTAASVKQGSHSLAISCDAGQVQDMLELGVVDPTTVKVYALRAAGEVAEAVLRINTIIRRRTESEAPGSDLAPSPDRSGTEGSQTP